MFECGDVILSIDTGWIVIIIDKDDNYYYCTRFYTCYIKRVSALTLPIVGKYYKIGNVREVYVDD